MLAILLPFSVFEMNADDKNAVMKIPLELQEGKALQRTLSDEVLVACYNGMLSIIHTMVYDGIGVIDVIVTNISTGVTWYNSFNSSLESQNILQISGDPGIYEITYTTESGDVYEGMLILE